jgi:hypothetical protein
MPTLGIKDFRQTPFVKKELRQKYPRKALNG